MTNPIYATRTVHRYRRILPPWWAFWRKPRLELVEKQVQTIRSKGAK